MSRLVAPDGLLVVNVADAAGLERLREQVRAVARADPAAELLVAGDPSVLSGTDEGNAVLVAAPDRLPERLAERLEANGPHPAEVLTGRASRLRALGRVLTGSTEGAASRG